MVMSGQDTSPSPGTSEIEYQPDTAEIRFRNVTKTYRNGDRAETVFRELSLEVKRGSALSILGASGCGKTTLLNVISGIEREDSGVVHRPTGRIGYMFQTDRLFPWRTAARNALLGVELTEGGISSEDRERCQEYFEQMGLRGVEQKYPSALSGGMRQRVALIRTLLCEPDVLLLDEPFSALDSETRHLLEAHVLRFLEERSRTMVFVTHDIGEAIAVGTRLLVLSGKPSAGVPVRIVWTDDVSFASDVAGRDPVAVREDPQFTQYYKLVWEALKDAAARSS